MTVSYKTRVYVNVFSWSNLLPAAGEGIHGMIETVLYQLYQLNIYYLSSYRVASSVLCR